VNPTKIGTHTLRKTFGRRFYELHKNKSEALIHLGYYFNHSDTNTTKIYIGVTQEEIENVIALM
jgi:site-specific recombinase XerD